MVRKIMFGRVFIILIIAALLVGGIFLVSAAARLSTEGRSSDITAEARAKTYNANVAASVTAWAKTQVPGK
jgi:uncharacterized membrane protein